MNRIDDITIERYLTGEMSASEQAEFRALMASDSALKRRVLSEETMLRAMRADRDSAVRDHAAVRARVLGSIPHLAPSGASIGASGSGAAFNPRWPIIGLVLLVASWIVIDVIALDEPARVTYRQRAPAVAPETPATTSEHRTPGAAPEMPARAVDASAAPADAPRSTASEPARTRATERPSSVTRSPESNARTPAATPTEVAEKETASEPAEGARKELPTRTDNVARTNVKIGD
jgi:hypothetical protein